MITVDGVSLTVIGVLNTAGDSSGRSTRTTWSWSPSPWRKASSPDRSSVPTIYVEAQSQGALGAAYRETDDELLALHQITNPAKADFSITTQSTLESTASSVNDALTFLLAGIAGDLAAGGRHRGDEHHARLGHRTGARDRSAKGARRDARGDSRPVPRRSHHSRADRRYSSGPASGCSAPSSCPTSSQTPSPLSGGR